MPFRGDDNFLCTQWSTYNGTQSFLRLATLCLWFRLMTESHGFVIKCVNCLIWALSLTHTKGKHLQAISGHTNTWWLETIYNQSVVLSGSLDEWKMPWDHLRSISLKTALADSHIINASGSTPINQRPELTLQTHSNLLHAIQNQNKGRNLQTLPQIDPKQG